MIPKEFKTSKEAGRSCRPAGPLLVRNISFKLLIYSPSRGSLMGIRKRRIVRAGASFIIKNTFISAIQSR